MSIGHRWFLLTSRASFNAKAAKDGEKSSIPPARRGAEEYGLVRPLDAI